MTLYVMHGRQNKTKQKVICAVPSIEKGRWGCEISPHRQANCVHLCNVIYNYVDQSKHYHHHHHHLSKKVTVGVKYVPCLTKYNDSIIQRQQKTELNYNNSLKDVYLLSAFRLHQCLSRLTQAVLTGRKLCHTTIIWGLISAEPISLRQATMPHV